MQVESLKDILEINPDKLKSSEKSRLINKIKQLIKFDNSDNKEADEEATEFPHRAISVVGKELVEISFDLSSKKARVVSTKTDTRDTKHNTMATAKALEEIRKIAKEQK